MVNDIELGTFAELWRQVEGICYWYTFHSPLYAVGSSWK